MKRNFSIVFTVLFTLLVSPLAIAEGQVGRAQFTSNIQDREPVDLLIDSAELQSKLYYFTELTGLAGETVTHRWEYSGEVQAEVAFSVGADRWRVWSSKNIQPEWIGEWRVTIVDSAGTVLDSASIDIR